MFPELQSLIDSFISRLTESPWVLRNQSIVKIIIRCSRNMLSSAVYNFFGGGVEIVAFEM